jgi:uncharacterized protein YggE
VKRFLLALLIAVPLAAQTVTQPPREGGMPETISVTGTGRVTLTPDRFTFTIGVQTTAANVEEAVNQNNARMSAVIAALKKNGASDQEIHTSNFNVYPQQEYVQGRKPRVTGYVASNSVTVTKKEIGTAGRLLQVALDAGVNESSGLNFEVSDPSRGREQGLRAAFEDARAKAALLAHAAGRNLGRAMTITEGAEVVPPPRPMMVHAMAAKAEAVSEVPIESGSRELSYTVSVVFDMR